MSAFFLNKALAREIAALTAISLLLALGTWLLHPDDFSLHADPTAYELDIAYPLVTVDVALDHFAQGQQIFIDTRDRATFEAGHIPGAMNLRPDRFDDDLGDVFDWILPEDQFVLYGVGNLKAAAAVAARLGERGYTQVAILAVDLEGWKRAGGEISGGAHE